MVDDFMVCVDRIIASACFEAVNEQGCSNNGDDDNSRVGRGVQGEENRCGNGNGKGEGSSKKNKMGEMIECRICQEEDEEQAMEAPCACNGTLKFAHRRCIQRWCNKKGDITCEICNQVYSPNYSLPPARPPSDGMAIDIRQNWGPHIDLHDPRILALAAAEHRLLQAEYEDYAAVNSGGLTCCRSVALILMLLLLIRHALMLTKDAGLVEDVSPFFNVSVLQFVAFLLPCYVMARAIYILQSRRRRQYALPGSAYISRVDLFHQASRGLPF